MAYDKQYIILSRETYDEIMNIIESHGYETSVEHNPTNDHFSFTITEKGEEGGLVLQRPMIVITKGVC